MSRKTLPDAEIVLTQELREVAAQLDACLALLREAMWALERHAPTLEAKIRALLAAHGEPRKETR